MELPHYIDYFAVSYSPEFVQTIVSIEASLQSLNYDKHTDLISLVFEYEGTESIRSLCDKAIEIYRTHLSDALQMQGFKLVNGDEDKLHILAEILNAVTVLAKADLETILEGGTVDEAEDDLSWVCNILSILTNHGAVELLQYVASVDEYVVDLLKAGETIDEFEHVNNNRTKERFLKVMGNEKQGIVIDAVRNLGYFGFDYKTLLKLVEDQLELLNDPVLIRREISLLLAASSLTTDSEVKIVANELVTSLYPSTQFSMLVNAKWGDFQEFNL